MVLNACVYHLCISQVSIYVPIDRTQTHSLRYKAFATRNHHILLTNYFNQIQHNYLNWQPLDS